LSAIKKKMKIALIRPNFGSYFQITPPLSLGYLSSSLKNNGYTDIVLVDASLDKKIPQEVNRFLKKENPDIIGIQVYTGSQNWVKELLVLLKSEKIHSRVIVGGPHISGLGELSLDYLGADFGILGEGEQSIVSFAQSLENKSDFDEVDGLIFKQKGKWKTARNLFGFIDNINNIPFPDWDLLNPEKYFNYMESVSLPLKGKKPTPILTSRGCPYQCTFCCSGVVSRHKIRYRFPKNIVSEIKYLKEKFGVDEIFFSDDNLTLNNQRAKEIFDLMIKEKLNIVWRAPNGIRIDSLTDSLVNKMAQSGCYFVGLGIETGSDKIMRNIKKNVDLNKVNEKVNLLQKYKIKSSGFFMCGLRNERRKDILKSIEFAKKIPFDRIQVCNFVPYPGSEDFNIIYDKANKKAYKNNVLKFQQNGFVPDFQTLSLTEIYKVQRKFLFDFYFRPKILYDLLKSFKISQLITLFKHPFFKKWMVFKKDWYDK